MTTTSKLDMQNAPPTCNFGFDFHRRRNLIHVSGSVVAYVVDNLLTLLDVETKEERYIRSATGGQIGMVAVSPAKDFIALGENGASPRISVYAYPEFELRSTLSVDATSSYSAGTFSSDGRLFASVSGAPDYWLTLWDWKAQALTLRAKTYGQDIYNIKFALANDETMMTYGTGHIQFWQMVKTFTGLKLKGSLGKFNGEPLSNITGALELKTTDACVLTSTEYGDLLVWRRGKVEIKVMRKHPCGKVENCHAGAIESISYIDNGARILTAGEDGAIRSWSVECIQDLISKASSNVIHLEPVTETTRSGGHLRHMCALDRERCVIQDMGNGLILLMRNNSLSAVKCAHTGRINGCVPSLNTEHFVTCGQDGGVHCYDYISRRMCYGRRFSSSATTLVNVPMCIDESGRLFIVGFEDGFIRILARNHKEWRLVSVTRPQKSAVLDLSWSQTASHFAVLGADSTAFVFTSRWSKSEVELEPLGFVVLDNTAKRIFWDNSGNLVADLGDTLNCYDVGAINPSLTRDSYQLDAKCTSCVNHSEYVQGEFQRIMSHDKSHEVIMSHRGSFEVHALTQPATIRRNDPLELLPAHEAEDKLPDETLSIEEELKHKQKVHSSEKEAVSRIRLASLISMCRYEFHSLLEENNQLDRKSQLPYTALFVDAAKVDEIREKITANVANSQRELQRLVDQGEKLAKQLQTKYFDKLGALPQSVQFSGMECTSFALGAPRAARSPDGQDALLTVESIAAPKSVETVDCEKVGIMEMKDDDAKIVGTSLQERRRRERILRSKELENVLNSKPTPKNHVGSFEQEEDVVFRLRCDPDAKVSSSENLTTRGKLRELESIDDEIAVRQNEFNANFDRFKRLDSKRMDDFVALCYAKADALMKCKLMQLGRLVVKEELNRMPEHDTKTSENQSKVREAQEQIRIAREAVSEAEVEVAKEEEALEMKKKLEVKINDDFEKLLSPGVSRAAILKVFHKRIVNKVKESKTEDACEDTESESESDFDDDTYYSSSDDENAPLACDALLYERVCELRLSRNNVLDDISNMNRSLESKKKMLESAVKKLRAAEGRAHSAAEAAASFEKLKQQSLNDIKTAFILPVSCVDTDSMSVQDGSEMLLFSKSKLAELESQIAMWDAETQKLKRQQHDLKREHLTLLTQCSEKAATLKILEAKYSEAQMRKFGKLVSLEDLDQVMSCAEGTKELREKLSIQGAENAKELQNIKRELKQKEDEVTELTKMHTERLENLMHKQGFVPMNVHCAN